MTAEQFVFLIAQLAVYAAALTGVVVAAYWVRFAAADFHRAGMARLNRLEHR